MFNVFPQLQFEQSFVMPNIVLSSQYKYIFQLSLCISATSCLLSSTKYVSLRPLLNKILLPLTMVEKRVQNQGTFNEISHPILQLIVNYPQVDLGKGT